VLSHLNDKTFKAAIIDLLKCTSDTNVQQNDAYDGFRDVGLAGLRIPPIALTDEIKTGAELLFKCCVIRLRLCLKVRFT
jgi:hypothetical protein